MAEQILSKLNYDWLKLKPTRIQKIHSENILVFCTTGGPYISKKTLLNFSILILITTTVHIAEIVWTFEVFITENFECAMNDVIFQN